ncbi:MAG: UvrD-helicase domain-containing protein [Acidimicrobiales bacterium]
MSAGHVHPRTGGPADPPDLVDRQLISAVGLDRTLFVEAGAGTGKTTQLVERIANLVLEGGVALADIAAITFTEAAAAELRSRIRTYFERRLAAATDLLELDRCRQALADTDRAAISTLHGFASRLLSEFAVDAGLPPRVTVADEVASQLAAEHRWQRFADALYDDPANEELLTRAVLVGIRVEPQYLGQPSLRDAAARLNENWDLLATVADGHRPPLRPLAFDGFDRAVADVADGVQQCRNPQDKLYLRATVDLLPEAAAVAALAPGRKLEALCAVGDSWSKHIAGKGSKQNWPDVVGARALVASVHETRTRIVQGVTDELLRHFLVLLAGHVLDSADARRAAGLLEFHDLLVLARSMLRHSPTARQALHRRYRHLLLDEFQDTDPLQIELAVLVATAVADPGSARWSSLEVEPGRLFFVGDPKQSIYRFRRADISLFLEARDRFGRDGGLARLNANFRTVGPVLDWVNGLFGTLMPDEQPGRQPAYEPLRAMRQPCDGIDHRPLLLGGPHLDRAARAADVRRAEAADVAATIADVIARPDAWPVGEEGGGWRPARLSDVTILLPARTSLPYLREALDGAAIPYRLATGTLVYDTQEVRDVLAVLRAVDDPSDELALVAALRSPLYACSDVELYRFRRAGGRWDLRSEPPDGLPADQPVSLAFAHLRSLWLDRWWHSPSELLGRVLRERHGFLLGFGAPRPADVWRRLRFLVDQARAFEDAGGGGLRAFLDWAALQGADGAAVHEPLLPELDEDAVRIMTMHGAKGLEFPITILSGMSTAAGGSRRGVSVLWGEDGSPELRLSKTLATEFHEPRADLEAEMDRFEKLRLLYVAATRARDHLVVSCHHKPPVSGDGPNRSFGQIVWTYHLDGGDALARRVEPPVSTASETASPTAPVTAASCTPNGVGAVVPLDTVEERRRWVQDRTALLAPHHEADTWSATAVVQHATAHAAPEAEAEPEGDPELELEDEVAAAGAIPGAPVAPTPFRRRGRAGTAIGRAVHATLQLVDLRNPQHVRAHVEQQCTIEAIEELADTVEAFVRAALDAPAVRLAATLAHHKELYVAAPLGGRVIEGYVDLLVETADGLVIVDYKTDGVRSEADVDAKLDHYELQAAAYAAALEAATGLVVHECRFVFCRAGGAIERTVRDLPGAVGRVRAIVGGDAAPATTTGAR